MTEYAKHRQVSNSKARLIGKPQRKMKPNAKPFDNNDENAEVSDEEMLKSLFVGMAGCIFFLLAVIVILVLVLIFGS